MLNIHRRQGALILIAFVLFAGQCYLVMRKSNIQQLPEAEVSLVESLKQSNSIDKVEHHKAGSVATGSTDQPINDTTTERYELMERYSQDTLPDIDPPFKRILFWNEAYGSKNYGVGLGQDALRKAGCPVWQCETSDDRSNVQEYDAVVFHLRSWTQQDLPEHRSPHQRYVFWSIESASWRFVDTNPMANFFNWTMTYRWDSDMVSPYGYIAPNGSVPLHPSADQMIHYLSTRNPTINYAQGKMKMAAWFVSNCASHSRRMEMVRELKNYIDVDVYGDCGTKVCPRKHEEDCRLMAAQKYKFYLSFENSLCLDYVTEKFFGMMHHPIVPIVVGFHDHHEKIAPPHSFINAANFQNMRALADYLMLLDQNDSLYNEYFWWKPHFEVRNSPLDFNRGMCHLCTALHNQTLPTKVYKDMTDWWDKQAKCRMPEI